MNRSGGLAGFPVLLAVVWLVLLPEPTAAHLVTTGMGPIYDGIGHLLLTPEDLMPVLALGLYAGLRGVVSGRRAMFLLPIAWFIGGVAGSMFGGISSPLSPAILFLILGGLVASDLYVPTAAVTALTIVLGLVEGLSNGAALNEGAGFLGLLGFLSMVFIAVALVSSFVVSLRRPWMRIAVRVAGSWILASGVLLLGWLSKGPT